MGQRSKLVEVGNCCCLKERQASVIIPVWKGRILFLVVLLPDLLIGNIERLAHYSTLMVEKV